MNTLDYVCIGVAIVSILIASSFIIFYRQHTKKTLEKIGTMLDTAIDGRFTEGVFDESTLSAVEAKLARYLSICAVSSKNMLVEKDKIKGLISDISHQTKTPIANILLYSQLLGEHELPEECTVCVKALSAQTEKLHFLISALVKTSRLETGIITVSPKQEEVQRLLDEVREEIMPKANAKDISIAFEDTEINAFFDLKWTTEAVYNVIDNAVKYTASGGHITIKAICYELFCRIDIIDNGIGLFLTREILATEGGYIKVSSLQGSGCTFSVFLPLK